MYPIRQIFILSLSAVILAACSDAASDAATQPNIRVEKRLHGYADYLSKIDIIATENSVLVKTVEVNRGNCPFVLLTGEQPVVLEMNKQLVFGSRTDITAKCATRDIQEVKVETDTGVFTFTF